MYTQRLRSVMDAMLFTEDDGPHELLRNRVANLERRVDDSEHSIAVQVSLNLVLRPVRWACLTFLSMVLIDKLDRRGITRKRDDLQ